MKAKMVELNVPLALAEMLHVTLGPLTDVLERQNHPWVKFLRSVLAAYTKGRDDLLTGAHGESILLAIDEVTLSVAETVCDFLYQLAATEEDFELWAKELADMDEPDDRS